MGVVVAQHHPGEVLVGGAGVDQLDGVGGDVDLVDADAGRGGRRRGGTAEHEDGDGARRGGEQRDGAGQGRAHGHPIAGEQGRRTVPGRDEREVNDRERTSRSP
ncbi:hypothetical protein TEK04_12410 [Klenkia sp. LSe6-5]|uniref:Uncharacterized protein n=1 Tax=Klenkia sesuvii TaxID=3103137 RepID=A0ABU8DUJ4_9ACTN